MASFYAYDFIYDDVSSKQFDLQIITFDDGKPFSGVGSSDIEIISQRVLRKSKPYYLGRTEKSPLEFSLTFGKANPISGMERDIISSWLFGRSEYKKLYILQDDLNGAYFNCFLRDPKPVYIGGINYAIECTVTCDSPYAYSFTKTTSGSYGSSGSTVENATFNIYNYSSEDDYLYPNVYFQMKDSGSYITLTNQDDDNREFTFGASGSPLAGGESISVNNDLQIVTSSTGLRRVSHFNKNWFRLVQKLNTVTLEGPVDWISIKYNERLKIGG
jgi:hypothetical protein